MTLKKMKKSLKNTYTNFLFSTHVLMQRLNKKTVLKHYFYVVDVCKSVYVQQQYKDVYMAPTF